MASKFFGEFMGTMILILMGNGVVANVLLKRSKAEGTGWLAITTGWAFAVMTGVFTAIACGSPDAHLNPAVTLGVAVMTGDFSNSCRLSVGANAGRDGGRRAGVAEFPAALGALRRRPTSSSHAFPPRPPSHSRGPTCSAKPSARSC